MLFTKLSGLIAISCLLSFSQASLYSELKLDDWKTYTSLASVRTISYDSHGNIWAGTPGGIFIYDTKNENFRELRNTEGLLSMDISCIRCKNDDSTIYIGTRDGFLHIVTDKFNWNYITDIAAANYPDPEITDIKFTSDFAFLSGGFGLTKFNVKDRVFVETVSRFASFSSNIKVHNILLKDGFIWVATDEGIARASVSSSISNPQVWELFSSAEGIPEKRVNFLIVHSDSIYAVTEKNICVFSDSTFKNVTSSADNETITGIVENGGELIYSTQGKIYKLDNTEITYEPFIDEQINGIYNENGSDDNVIILYKAIGIGNLQDGINKLIVPNSPQSNIFANMDVDEKGRLWVATNTKTSLNGMGFTMLDVEGKWNNFTNQSNKLINNSCIKINSFANGRVYVSTWGGGLLEVKENKEQFDISRYDTSNSPLTGATTSSPGYVIAGETLEDNNGLIWLINYGESSAGPLLVSLDKSGNFQGFNNNESQTERQFLELAMDSYGTKWMGSNNFSKGIYYYNDNNTHSDLSDDKFGKLTKSNSGLIDNEITAIEVDNNGVIWIGTPVGLNFILDPYPALSNEKIYVREERFLKDQFIRDIYIDAIGNKWIATNKGIFVLNPDASELLTPKTLNTKNCPIISDDILSITSDPATGIMYFGSKTGLSSVQSTSVKATQEYKIKFSPQPYNPVTDGEMLIDGLEENSDVRVLTLDGALVKELSAVGRVTLWDGKDEFGAYVSSGVYLVSGSSITTGNGGLGKFTVIRK